MMVVIPGCIDEDEKVDIYASIYPVYFMADYIVQDKLVVKQVYPVGADVHEYDPGNGRDLVRMSKAKIMFFIGAGLEGFITKSEAIFEKEPIELVELSQYVKLCKQTSDGFAYLTEEELEVSRGVADKHIWLDPIRMITMAEVMVEKIIKIDPENEDFYKTNTEKLILELRKLDKAYSESLNNLDLFKMIMVDHDSYLYWEERYGLQRLRTRVNNDSCESNPSNISATLEKAKEYNIKYIVTTENETVCGIIDKYASLIDAEIVEMNHLSTLYKDDVNNGKDYFSIMYDNLEILKKILSKK